jgi:peptide/nickel transport system substrate-binding protein
MSHRRGFNSERQVTLYNRRVHNHTVTADGLGCNLADVFIA